MSEAKRKRKCSWLRKLKLRCSLVRRLARVALVPVVDNRAAEAAAKSAVAQFLADSLAPSNAPGQFTTDDVLNVAEHASSFIRHTYWNRMLKMLKNIERVETDALLDPTQQDQHALCRASVAICRKVIAMPYTDIEQGKQAVAAVERHSLHLA